MFDRLGRLLRSFVPEEERLYAGYDPDLTSAFEELESFLETGAGGATRQEERRERRRRTPLEEAYAVLELPPGVSFDSVRERYKGLLRKYHPDRFAGRPEKQRAATEVTQAIIAAYRTIRESEE